MSFQATSWSDAHGAPQYPRLVAQIFFPTNVATLDSQDIEVLTHLVSQFRLHLLGRRIELSFVGQADHRGTERHNLELAERRARSVKEFLDERLGHSPNYSSWRVASFGEQHAARDSPSPQRMAEDRKVDVFSSFSLTRTGAPIQITGQVPMVSRIMERRFSSSDISDLSRQPSTSGGDIAWREAMSLLRRGLASGGELEQFLAGSENRDGRVVRSIPGTHGVNAVEINWRYRYYTEGLAEVQSTNVVVRYTWGPPRETVNVTTRFVTEVHSQTGTETITETLSRSVADSTPFVFPPNP